MVLPVAEWKTTMASVVRSRRLWMFLIFFFFADVLYLHFRKHVAGARGGLPSVRGQSSVKLATSSFRSLRRQQLGQPPSEEEVGAYKAYNERLSKRDGGDLLKQFQCNFSHDSTWPATPDKPEPVAIVSLLSATVPQLLKDYILGLEVLGYSLAEHVPHDVHRIIMLLEGSPCDDVCQWRLHDAGWRLCTAPKILPPHPSDFARFRDQFVKLVLWNMVQYKRVVYMDADTLAVGRLDRLLATAVSSKNPMAAGQDISAGRWVNGFNMGVAVISTSATEFLHLYRTMKGDTIKYQHTMSEQGFLSVVYGGKWLHLLFQDNANLAAWLWDRKQWLEKSKDIRVIHYTMEKGWQIGPKSTYVEPGKLWWARKYAMCQARCSKASLCKLALASSCDCKKAENSTCDYAVIE